MSYFINTIKNENQRENTIQNVTDEKFVKVFTHLDKYIDQLHSKNNLKDIDIQAKKLCSQMLKEYEIWFSQLKEDYERAKEQMMNALYLRLRELSVFSRVFENIPNDVLLIHNDWDTIQNNRNLISTLRNEYEEKRKILNNKQKSESDLSKLSDSTFGERIATNEEIQITVESVESIESNSNYDYEMGATEAKNLWRKHMGDEPPKTVHEDRFKKSSKHPFKTNLSKIDREASREEVDWSNLYLSIKYVDS